MEKMRSQEIHAKKNPELLVSSKHGWDHRNQRALKSGNIIHKSWVFRLADLAMLITGSDPFMFSWVLGSIWLIVMLELPVTHIFTKSPQFSPYFHMVIGSATL